RNSGSAAAAVDATWCPSLSRSTCREVLQFSCRRWRVSREADKFSRQSLAPDPGPLAVVCLPSSFWRLRRPASSPRGQGSRRIAALLSTVKGHRPSRALDFALRGRDGGL